VERLPHSWKAFDLAKKITDCLIEAGIIDKKNELKARGIIQIKMEE